MKELNAVEQYIDNWLVNGKELNAGDTESLRRFMKELGDELDKLSIVPDNGGTKLILYSGQNGGFDMWRIAEGASATGQGYYFMSDTEAGEFLNKKKKFWDKINEVCGYDKALIDRIFGNEINGSRQAYVTEGCLAINDYLSYRLAESAYGDVTIWAPDCELYKILPQTELRAILLNKNVTSINGIPKQHFIDAMGEDKGETIKESEKRMSFSGKRRRSDRLCSY